MKKNRLTNAKSTPAHTADDVDELPSERPKRKRAMPLKNAEEKMSPRPFAMFDIVSSIRL
jgi:hypothetical protein